ncbi:hypothetical protein M0811_12823 [Anaeramoeba ignava]|uniref:Uncharacterized protein n=1 Tax=Anaeramoeba ignava TaxID=1746090 RepID=A0A9Q0L9K3_ANAIG|nr:hypothetical protein M0811_12823 [Anaeramoeba ignava]
MINFTPKNLDLNWENILNFPIQEFQKNKVDKSLLLGLEDLYVPLIRSKIKETDSNCSVKNLIKLFQIIQYVIEFKENLINKQNSTENLEEIKNKMKNLQAINSKLIQETEENFILRKNLYSLEQINSKLERKLNVDFQNKISKLEQKNQFEKFHSKDDLNEEIFQKTLKNLELKFDLEQLNLMIQRKDQRIKELEWEILFVRNILTKNIN